MTFLIFFVEILCVAVLSLIESFVIYCVASLLTIKVAFKLIFFVVFIFNLFFNRRGLQEDKLKF